MSMTTRLSWRLLAAVALASGAATGNSADLALTASWDTFLVSEQGVPPTLSTAGLTVIDVDGDGRDEIIVGQAAAVSPFRRVRHSPAFGRMVVDLSVPPPYQPEGGINSELSLVTTLTPGGPYKAIVWQEHSVAIYDLNSGRLERLSDPTGFQWPRPVCAIDLDGDGNKEILARDGLAVRVMNTTLTRELGQTFIPQGFLSEPGVVCANLDRDAAIEVAVENGDIYEFEGYRLRKQGSVVSNVNGYPMRYVGSADLDGDDNEELVAAYYGLVRAYDIETGEISWTVEEAAVRSRIWASRLADINQDGVRDLLLVTESSAPISGAVLGFAGDDGRELFRAAHPDVNGFAVNAGDFDGDGSIEIAATLVRPFTRPNRLYIYDATSGALEWRSEDELPPVAAAMGDLDHDGSPEIVAVIGGVAGVGDIRLLAFDAHTFAHRWATSHQILPVLGTGPIAALGIGDVDGNGTKEIVVGMQKDLDAQVVVIDGTTRRYLRSIVLPGFDIVNSLVLTDLNGDGSDEIVAAASAPYGAGYGGETFILSGASGQTLARGGLGIFQYRDLWSVEVADVDGDGHRDIVTVGFGVYGGMLGIMDGATHSVRGEISEMGHQSVALVDVDSDGRAEIVLGNLDGSIEVRRASDLATLRRLTPCSTPIAALTTNTLPGANAGDVFYSCDDRIGTVSLRAGGIARGITGVIGYRVGYGDELMIAGTAAAPIINATSHLGLRHLQPGPDTGPYVIPGNHVGGPAVFAASPGVSFTGTITFGTTTGRPTQLELIESTAHGALTLIPQGGFTYLTHSGNLVDHFTVRATDGVAQSVPTTLAIIVANRPPIVPAFSEFTVAPGQVLTTASLTSDPDGDPLTFTLVTQPSRGTVTFSSSGVMTYTPAAGQTGDDTFEIYASDERSRSTGNGTIVIHIQSPATPPPPPTTPGGSPSGGGGGGIIDPGSLCVALLLAWWAGWRRRLQSAACRTPALAENN
jgi:outer membrane protein assembly factor BamB